jgi:hypothetical protein
MDWRKYEGVPSNQVRIQNDGQYEVRLDISGIHS